MVVPVTAIDPGLIVQVPVAGSSFNTTLPVGAEHEEGCMIAPIVGAKVAGASFIIISAEGRDIHPASLVTLNL